MANEGRARVSEREIPPGEILGINGDYLNCLPIIYDLYFYRCPHHTDQADEYLRGLPKKIVSGLKESITYTEYLGGNSQDQLQGGKNLQNPQKEEAVQRLDAIALKLKSLGQAETSLDEIFEPVARLLIEAHGIFFGPKSAKKWLANFHLEEQP